MPAPASPAADPRPVYLDNHSTTRVDPRVVAAMLPWFDVAYGNAASTQHAYGREAAAAVETARREVAGLLQAPADSLIFTSGGTESNNLAILGCLGAAPQGKHLIVSAIEHPAVLDPARRLQRRGAALTIVPVDAWGRVDPQAIAAALRPETTLVSIMLASNEVGTIQPVAEIARLCRERGVWLHCDAVQALGRIPLHVDELGADLVSLSAHKVYGPKGTGALYIRRGDPPLRLEPLLYGGGHERHLRSGTLAVPSIVGFGTACRLAGESLAEEMPRLARLRDRLCHALQTRIPGVRVNGHPEHRLPGNLHVSFEDVDGERLLQSLTQIAVSSGSACSSADPKPSHVLRAMGISESLSKASLRFGLGRFTTDDDIEIASTHIAEVVARLRTRP